jgi:hypothetical protein
MLLGAGQPWPNRMISLGRRRTGKRPEESVFRLRFPALGRARLSAGIHRGIVIPDLFHIRIDHGIDFNQYAKLYGQRIKYRQVLLHDTLVDMATVSVTRYGRDER